MSDQKEVLTAMLAKAKEKLETGKLMRASGHYDDAASRAYYAAFHAISAALYAKGLSFSSHSQTIGAFNREFVKTALYPVGFGEKIQKLFDDRQTGDYDIASPIDGETADEDIAIAEDILGKVEEQLRSLHAI